MSIENQEGRNTGSILGTPEIARAYHSRMKELLKMTPEQYDELQRGLHRWSKVYLKTNTPEPIPLEESLMGRVRGFFGFSASAGTPDSR